MSHGSDLEIESAEQIKHESDVDRVALEAAKSVVLDNMNREAAISKAIDLKEREDEARQNNEFDEVEGGGGRFWESSLNGSKPPQNKVAQIKAIAAELRPKVDLLL